MNVPEQEESRSPVTVHYNQVRRSSPSGDLQSNARVLDLSTWAEAGGDDPIADVGHGLSVRAIIIRDIRTEMVRFQFILGDETYWIDTPVESVEQHLRSMFPAPANNWPTAGFMHGGQGYTSNPT